MLVRLELDGHHHDVFERLLEGWGTGRPYLRMDEYFRWKQQQWAAEEDVHPAA